MFLESTTYFIMYLFSFNALKLNRVSISRGVSTTVENTKFDGTC